MLSDVLGGAARRCIVLPRRLRAGSLLLIWLGSMVLAEVRASAAGSTACE